MHKNLISDIHEHRLVGHPGRERLAELLNRSYFIPGKTKKIAEVIDNCEKCHTSKPVWQKLQGRLQPIPVPSEPWEGIAFDLIVKLPTSVEPLTRCAYDSIWVVANYLTKYTYFIPYKEASSAEELVYAVLRTVIAAHGVPRYIITDRAKVYTSKFWECKGCWDVQPGRPNEVPVVCRPSAPRISRGRSGSWIYEYPRRQGTVGVP
jgi:Integrase zinc binding domain